MEYFRIYQPRIAQTKDPSGVMPWPSENVYLPALREMLCPMRQHHNHENPKSRLVPTGIDLIVKALVAYRYGMHTCC
jgi:hypothetical protein